MLRYPTAFGKHQFTAAELMEFIGITGKTFFSEVNNGLITPTTQKVGSVSKKFYDWEDHAKLANRFKDRVQKPKRKMKTFGNLKGGVGKTSISLNVATQAATFGLKVLFLDLDAQWNSTLSLGINGQDKNLKTVFHWLKGAKFDDVVLRITPNFHFIPSNLRLNKAERYLRQKNNGQQQLRMLLAEVEGDYDLIIMDTNPALTFLSINAFLAADEICVVAETETFSVQGMASMFEVLDELAYDYRGSNWKPGLRIIPNIYDVRESSCQTAIGALRKGFDDYLANTVIRKTSDFKDAQNNSLPVFFNKKRSNATQDIVSFTRELLNDSKVLQYEIPDDYIPVKEEDINYLSPAAIEASTPFGKYRFSAVDLMKAIGISKPTFHSLLKSGLIAPKTAKVGKVNKKVYDWNDLYILADRFKDRIVKPNRKRKVFGNLKGGVGKTSIAVNVAAAAALNGLKVLFIDLDPQWNSTLALGINPQDKHLRTAFHLFKGAKLEDVVLQLTPKFHLIPSTLRLNRAESYLRERNNGQLLLKNLLDKIEDQYDLIIMDTNPALTFLSINAFLAADEVCVVAETETFSVSGMASMFEVLDELLFDFQKSVSNPGLRIIPNIFAESESSCQTAIGALTEGFGDFLASTIVRKSADFKDAQNNALPVFFNKKNSNATQDISLLTNELLSDAESPIYEIPEGYAPPEDEDEHDFNSSRRARIEEVAHG